MIRLQRRDSLAALVSVTINNSGNQAVKYVFGASNYFWVTGESSSLSYASTPQLSSWEWLMQEQHPIPLGCSLILGEAFLSSQGKEELPWTPLAERAWSLPNILSKWAPNLMGSTHSLISLAHLEIMLVVWQTCVSEHIHSIVSSPRNSGKIPLGFTASANYMLLRSQWWHMAWSSHSVLPNGWYHVQLGLGLVWHKMCS